MDTRDWERFSEISEKIDIDDPAHKENLKKIIQLGETHARLADQFNEILSQEDVTGINKGQIRKTLGVIDEWIFDIMAKIVPISVMSKIQEKLQEEELLRIERRNCPCGGGVMDPSKPEMTSSEFLETQNEEVEFEDASHIRRYFAIKDFRKDSRHTADLEDDHGERHAIKSLLTSYPNRYTFPLKVRKRERPDFLLLSPDMEIGLEISQATTTEIERDYNQILRRGNSELVEYAPDGHNIRSLGAPLEGRGFFGHQDCLRVAKIAAEALKSKIEKLNKRGFYRASSDQLLLLFTYGLTLDLDDPSEVKALQDYLCSESNEVVAQSNCTRHFDGVHFIYESYIFIDITKDSESARIPL